jgi:acyl carrier protein
VKPEELKSQVLAVLSTIAPELEPGELRADKALRSQVDLDSMDWLNFLVALHERLKVDIPEADYAKLVTLDDLLAYLKKKMP